MKFKRCASCGETKNIILFSLPRLEYCKECNNRRIREWRKKKNAELAAARGPSVPKTHKACKRCKEVKPLSSYYPQGNWHSSYCKPCCVLNAEERRTLGGPDYRKAEKLKYKCKKVGTNPEWFNQTLTEQNNVCALCRQPETHPIKRGSSVVRSLAIDHDHETGKVRGLLCFRCNTAIHQLEKHGYDWAERAVVYLRRETGETC